MQKNLKTFFISLFILSIVFVPIFVGAQGENTPPQTGGIVKIPNPFNCGNIPDGKCTLMDLLTTILNNVVMPIASVVAVIFIIWAGFKYIQAQGNEKAIGEAHARLLWVLIGVGVLLSAAGISAVLQSTVRDLIKP